MEKIPYLIEALPYVQKLKGTTFVIKISGSAVKVPEERTSLAMDISLLHHFGIRTAIVHGGGVQADELLEKLNVPVRKVNGRRITDLRTLEAVKMVYVGKINTEIVAALQKARVSAVGLSGIDAATISAEKRRPQKVKNLRSGRSERVDFGYVGDVTRVDTELVKSLFSASYVPVLASFGIDKEGMVLNINADTVAKDLAISLGADKLINVSNVPGVLEDPKDRSSTISYLNLEKARRLLRSRSVSGGMLPKLLSCIEAVEGGVRRVHIVDGTSPHSLLIEVFTNQGCGTMVVSKEEERRYLGVNGNG